MAINWVEDVVSQLFKMKGYMVVENEDLQLPKTEKRKVRGHSDIDVLAIKDKEICHIECQSWWGPSKGEEQRELHRLKERFEHAPKLIFNKYKFLNSEYFNIRKIFVTSGRPQKLRGGGPWDRLSQFCSKNEIELIEINDIIRDLISTLKKKYPKKDVVGKEVGITRFLLHLIKNDFL